ncbi:fa3f074e-b493-40ec-b301-4af4686e7b4b [Thermothielavioides terrestris]|uniref:Fa3f074e-b493-40ec-b301-4af4686e7b4b n=1 Tax=Thermothielavioides terrestris TaxID=2587410 RepID=A0A446BVC3_9PEZI|nr:fa3f074e-b493-40ec-b301-4af4686e7b4b [Thermothielavioides terrestris]
MASPAKLDIRPSAAEALRLFEQTSTAPSRPTLLPVCITVPSDLLTPSAIYLKLSSGATAEYSFLLESAAGSTETIGRYSFIGANPRKVLATGPGYDDVGDPLRALEAQLGQDRVVSVPSLRLPSLTGGAVGYISYDCIKYFEPRTARPLKDNLHIPEALFMIFDTIVAFDHFFQALTIVTHMRLPQIPADDFQAAYEQACATIRSTLELIQQPEIPLPPKKPAKPASSQEYSSNVGRHGYESFVTSLKSHIIKGDIIQAVPSQRFSRGTSLHPFNIYRTLRTLNPSPYLFFLSCADFHIVGASPECLMKTDGYAPLPVDTRFAYSEAEQARSLSRPRIVNHAIAGTIRRGANPAEDDELAAELQASTKDRAEHVMLVDLARNDVNRVCHPSTVKVDRLMRIDRFSHVQHLTSEVSGLLRPECTRWDAMRSIFPAGTVSGAPKIRAMELIYDLEQEKRGIYAGAAGWFAYDVVRVDEKRGGELVLDEGQMDTCIAIRTMLVKDEVAYLQAGGGIVFDSEKTEEWMETMNKLAANLRCIELAEQYYGEGGGGGKSVQEIIEEERRKGDEYYRLQTLSAGA